MSHSLREITTSCTRAVWLDEGELRMQGDPHDVVAAYEADG
ncbi:MAG: hypothetical protein AAF081_15715 [Actinomycetota bacterium]